VFLPTVGKSPIALFLLLMVRLGKKRSSDRGKEKNGGPKDDVAVLNIEVEHFLASLLD
jgi:hypothetical protein